jgi:hypothetical protein
MSKVSSGEYLVFLWTIKQQCTTFFVPL